MQALQKYYHSDSQSLLDEDIKHLPKPVQRYLYYTGVVGEPKLWNFRIEFEGRMKLDEKKDWTNITSEQYNFLDSPVRLFYIKTRMFGLPIYGLHLYKDEKGIMQIKAAGLITVVDARGPEMNEGDTVTLFNDMCLFAPASLIDPRISWETIDNNEVKAVFTNGANKISAILYFNEIGELTNFVSDDRSMTASDGSYQKLKWSTPIKEYREVNGIKVPYYAEAIWTLHDNQEYKYAQFYLKDIKYNCSK